MISFGVIFDDLKEWDLRDEIEDESKKFCSVLQKDKVETDVTNVTIKPILSKICGLHFKSQRPNKIAVVEPINFDRRKYRRWIVREVIPAGSSDCLWQYIVDGEPKSFVSREQFAEFINQRLG